MVDFDEDTYRRMREVTPDPHYLSDRMFSVHTYQDRIQVQAWLDELTYRPGSQLAVDEHSAHRGQITVRMIIFVFNSYGQPPLINESRQPFYPSNDDQGPDTMRAYLGMMLGDLIKVTTVWALPGYLPEQGREEFRRWLRKRLHEWECHESDEWLKEKGARQPLFDPHANGRTAL